MNERVDEGGNRRENKWITGRSEGRKRAREERKMREEQQEED